jgi:hypothetical protein
MPLMQGSQEKAELAFLLLTLLAIGAFALIRYRSDRDRRKLSDEERHLAIAKNLLIGILLPFLSSGLVMRYVSGHQAYFSGHPEIWMLAIGTLATVVGLPFVLKAIRLVRNDASAGALALVMSGYGAVLWVAVFLLLLRNFMKSCC